MTRPELWPRRTDRLELRVPTDAELDAVLAQPGRWRAELAVQDGQTLERAAFSLRVLTSFQLGLSFIAIIAALLGSLALLGFGRFTRPRGRRVPETGPFTA